MKKISMMLLTVMLVATLLQPLQVLATSNDTQSELSSTSIKSVISKYFDNYYTSLKIGEMVDSSELFINEKSAAIPTGILRSELIVAKEFNELLDEYSLTLNFTQIDLYENVADVCVSVTNDFHYEKAPEDFMSQKTIVYNLQLQYTDGDWKISRIWSETDFGYQEIESALKVNLARGSVINDSAVAEFFAQKEEYIPKLKKSLMEAPKAEETKHRETNQDISQGSVVATRSSYSYNASVGVSYALKYAPANATDLIFAAANPDCTNFVSQCVWAAYGGWQSSQTAEVNQQRVADKIRMVNGNGSTSDTNAWFGARQGYGAIANSFSGVTYFYNYVTKSKSEGPNGVGYGTASTPNFSTGSVGAGDVIQFYKKDYGNWRHSVYVNKADYISTSPGYRDVYICAHSGNRKNVSISEYLTDTNNSQVRGIYFVSANFSK